MIVARLIEKPETAPPSLDNYRAMRAGINMSRIAELDSPARSRQKLKELKEEYPDLEKEYQRDEKSYRETLKSQSDAQNIIEANPQSIGEKEKKLRNKKLVLYSLAFAAICAGAAVVSHRFQVFNTLLDTLQHELAHPTPTQASTLAPELTIPTNELYGVSIAAATTAPTLEPTTTVPESTPSKINFNRNIVTSESLDNDVEAPGLDTSIFCLDENGDTFAMHLNSPPAKLPANLLICVQQKDGKNLYIDMANTSGDTLVIAGTGRDLNLLVTQGNSLATLQERNVWERIDKDDKNPNQPGIPDKYKLWYDYIRETLKKKAFRFQVPKAEYGVVVEVAQ